MKHRAQQPPTAFPLTGLTAPIARFVGDQWWDTTNGLLKLWNGTVWTQISDVGGPPSGAAGGDLAGTYPNPTVETADGADKLNTARTINGIAFDGTANISLYTTNRQTGQTGAVANVVQVTAPGADATYQVSANVNVTTSTTHNFTVTCTYTDETNTSRVLTLGFTQLSGATLLTAITNVTGAGPYESVVYHIRAKAGTTITIATTGSFVSVTYNVEGAILQVTP